LHLRPERTEDAERLKDPDVRRGILWIQLHSPISGGKRLFDAVGCSVPPVFRDFVGCTGSAFFPGEAGEERGADHEEIGSGRFCVTGEIERGERDPWDDAVENKRSVVPVRFLAGTCEILT